MMEMLLETAQMNDAAQRVGAANNVRAADKLAALRQRLLHRIGRRFRTLTEEVSVGPVKLNFTRIADPNFVLDEMAEAEDLKDKLAGYRRPSDDLNLPYWAELWDSAYGVSDYFRQLFPADQLSRMSVLDLGCGMGLTGTVAAALGAKVLFADLSPDALLFAQLNSAPYGERVRTRQLNWRTARLTEQFDLIIGADILYERAQWTYLEPFWKGHVRAGGMVMLGEPGRSTGDYFLDWIQGRGWNLERAEQAVATRPRPIRLFKLTLE